MKIRNRRLRLPSVALAALAGVIAAPAAHGQGQLPPQPYPPPPPPPQGRAAAPAAQTQVWQPPHPTPAAPAPDATPPRGDRWQAAAGGGALMIRSAGLDPFSTEDALGRFSLSGSVVVWRQERLALAVGLGLDTGSSSAAARSAPSELWLTLVSATAEARYHLAPRLYAFGRLAPGIQHVSATLKDPSTPGYVDLRGGFTTVAVATSVGAAFCINGPSNTVGLWFVLDAGYLLAPSRDLLLRPDVGDDVAQVASLDLGAIAPRGIFGRAALALSY
jgi:hypothetical protein